MCGAIREWALVTRRRPIISISLLMAVLSRYKGNEPTDAASQEAIREHLAMIAVKFAQGDFDIPMFIHATVPPGVETMKRLIDKIIYQAENTTQGAQLRITTHDTQALSAIHSFLRFQIREHQTGDSLEEQK